MTKDVRKKFSKLLYLLVAVFAINTVVPLNVYADETLEVYAEEALEVNADETPEVNEIEAPEANNVVEENAANNQESQFNNVEEIQTQNDDFPTTRATYIVTFDADNGTAFQHFTDSENGKITDKPANPTKLGHTFAGWYAFLDENDNPVLWDFDNGIIDDNTTLWAAWERSANIIAFDPNDGATPYLDFHFIEVPFNGKIPNTAPIPKYDGHFFKYWAYVWDENDIAVPWDFANMTTEEDNLTLWAEWEDGVILAFDPNDKPVPDYPAMQKETLHIGDKFTGKVPVPKRDGYIFHGWAYAYDENDNPLICDFTTQTFEENTTVWAEWEQGVILTFDPNDWANPLEPDYNAMQKETLRIGAKFTGTVPVPKRDGYVFKGWALYYDENDKPIFCDFTTQTFDDNTTVWAEWEKASTVVEPPTTGPSSPGRPVPTGPPSRVTTPSEPKPTEVPHVSVENNNNPEPMVEVPQTEIPQGTIEKEEVEISETAIPQGTANLDDIPKTGYRNNVMWILFATSSLGIMALFALSKRKNLM